MSDYVQLQQCVPEAVNRHLTDAETNALGHALFPNSKLLTWSATEKNSFMKNNVYNAKAVQFRLLKDFGVDDQIFCLMEQSVIFSA